MNPGLPDQVVAVATSGGRDSTALLHAVCRQAAGSGLQVVALHVHHGLNAAADEWLAHLQRQCARWSRRGWPVRLEHERLVTRPQPGQSVEAWARRERYAALTRMAKHAGAGLVLLAHHRRDQAETVFLQALRGSGSAGLAAMPECIEREGLLWARPWLGQSSQAIGHYVRRWGFSHIDDDSNSDPRFDRNRLRHQVWPVLTQHFEQVEEALAAVARQAAQTAALMDEVAAADLAPLLDVEGRLSVTDWQDLSPARRRFALKAWLAQRLTRGVSEHLLQRLMDELPGRSTARLPDGQGGELRLYRARLSWAKLNAVECAAGAAEERPAELCLDLSLPGDYPLASWRGGLRVRSVDQGGLAQRWLGQVRIAPRAGGERFQAAPGGLPRSLKKQYQAAGVPSWARSVPLLRSTQALGDQLLFVPGLGLDARVVARAGEPQCSVEWWVDE